MLKLGTDQHFYVLLEKQAAVAEKAATAFHTLVLDFDNLPEHAKIIAEIEREGDDLTHELQNKVASTFITPLDKEDLRDLSQVLDDITDLIEAAAARAELYRLTNVRPDLSPLSGLLVQTTAVTKDAVAELKNGFTKSPTLKATLEEIHRLENESDRAFRSALATLFDEPNINPLQVIKWKEIYDRIESSVDRCEDIAKIIGTLVVKYA